MININIIFFLLISIIGLYLAYFISLKFNLIDFPDKKKIHTTKTPNIGGAAIIFLILTSFFIYDYNDELRLIFILCISVIIIGLSDDIKNYSAIIKLILISVPVIFFIKNISVVESLGIFFEYNLILGKFSFIFTFLCMLLLINATNYMDGMDGLISLMSILSFSYILILIPKNEWITLIPIICFLIVFLFFNFGILPKQFLGDTGSLGLGFILSSFSIYYTQTLNYIEPSIIIWCLSFYVFEFLTINIIRIKKRKNVLEKDLNFIFNILNNKTNQINTLAICCLIKIFFLLNGLILNYYELYDVSILIFFFYFFIYLGIRIKYLK